VGILYDSVSVKCGNDGYTKCGADGAFLTVVDYTDTSAITTITPPDWISWETRQK